MTNIERAWTVCAVPSRSKFRSAPYARAGHRIIMCTGVRALFVQGIGLSKCLPSFAQLVGYNYFFELLLNTLPWGIAMGNCLPVIG